MRMRRMVCAFVVRIQQSQDFSHIIKYITNQLLLHIFHEIGVKCGNGWLPHDITRIFQPSFHPKKAVYQKTEQNRLLKNYTVSKIQE